MAVWGERHHTLETIAAYIAQKYPRVFHNHAARLMREKGPVPANDSI